jgi:predicted O-linked N-acetylglucosamine transferase (SPINDLY family)
MHTPVAHRRQKTSVAAMPYIGRKPHMTLAELLEQALQLQTSGQLDAADRLYAEWIAGDSSPLRCVAMFNRGSVLGQLGRQTEAAECYSRALRIRPDFAPAWLNMGHHREREGRAEDALTCWKEVYDGVASGPSTTLEHRLHGLNQAARLLEQLKRLSQAEGLLRRSLELQPAQLDVIQHYVSVRQKQCQWPAQTPPGAVNPNQMLLGTSAMSTMALHDDPALQLLAAMRFVHERVPKAAAVPMHSLMPPRAGRIKIGYLSGDLHHHAVGLLTAELFELHDRSRFEIHGFCWTPESPSPQRQRILKALDQHTRLAGVDDHTAARLIAQAGIDVLVDLQGLTSGARPAILGYRAAPVQVAWLGLPGTSAVPGVDWMLADRYVMPPELLPYCTEQPVYLPHCYQISDRQREVGSTPERVSCGLPEDAFVYCSFNNNHKFTPEVFDTWMRVLSRVPRSVLWLLADNDTARENMLRRADAHGVARERLVFAGRVSPADYLARFRVADLVLDTFPYNAGTTANDVLWVGTPILTLSGRTYISRMAGSLLTAVGLPDLITHSLAEYEQRAVDLGQHPLRIASYKRYLAEHGHRSPLFDIPGRVRDIEDALEPLALAHRATTTSTVSSTPQTP